MVNPGIRRHAIILAHTEPLAKEADVSYMEYILPMKGCFVLHRRFAYLGHYIARHLKDRKSVQEFCGIVYTKPSLDFITAQTDIEYGTLLYDEEIHARYKTEKLDPAYLDALEKEYGLPSLWPYLAVDRIIMSNQLVREYPHDWPRYSHEDMLRLLQVYAKAVTEFLDKERPDFVFFSAICTTSSFLLYHMAKKRGIQTLVVQMASTKNRYIVGETYDSFTGVDELFHGDRSALANLPERKEAETFLREFRERPTPYYDKSTPTQQPVGRHRQFRFLNPRYGLGTARVLLNNLREHFSRTHKDEYSYIGPWTYFKDASKRKLRNFIGLNDLYDEFTPKQDDFVFFPLHLEPEIALLLQAPFQTDQVNLIRQIARSLPVHHKLYVKDHPEMAQYRPRSFYKAIKRNPNVKLIDASISSFHITPHAKLITTITGSVGWEALMFKKPVITFGHVFYNSLPMTTFCDRMEQLPLIIKERLAHDLHDEEELVSFLTALFKDSAELNLHHLWMDEPSFERKMDGVKPLADALAKKIRPLG